MRECGKIRILAVEKLLIDNPNGLSTNQILSKLQNLFDISANRKTIYDDYAVLEKIYNLQNERKGRYLIWKILR